MKPFPRLAPALVAAMGLGLVLIPPGRGAEDEDKEAIARTRKVLLELMKVKDDDLAKKAPGVMKEADLMHVMRAFAPRSRGGIGVGPERGGDGIELKLLKMQRTQLTRGELAKEKEDLLQMARVIRVVTEVARHGGPSQAAKKKMWLTFSDNVQKTNAAFTEAVNKGDTKAVKEAVGNLSASCLECHDEFR